MTDYADMVADLQPGQVRFFHHAIPSLDAGQYELTVSQRLSREGIDPAAAPFETSQAFRVEASRLGLLPNDVHSVYPPADSTGHYDATIPHIVLRRRSLPWEVDDRSGSDRVPWMALLVFHPGEEPTPQTGSVADLLTAGRGGKVDGRHVPVGLADHVAADSLVSVIDVDDFQRVRPQASDRRWLGHVRQVRTDNKELLGLDEDGWFSVMVANRLPVPGRNVVHLVSLDGVNLSWGRARLVSLASWSFTAEASRGDFSEKIAAVGVGALKAATDGAPAAQSDAARTANEAIDAGFVPLRYDMRHGEQSVGWYRGPLVPMKPPTVRRAPLPTAEAGLIYHPSLGMFDVSIAVAWQLGRLLALADGSFSAALMEWRQQAQSYVDATLARTDAARLHAQLEDSRSLAALVREFDDDPPGLETALRKFILDLWDPDSTATKVADFARRSVFGEIEAQLPPPRRDEDRLRPADQREAGRAPQSMEPSGSAVATESHAPNVDAAAAVAAAEQQVEDIGLMELAMPELPEEISTWLGRLALLYGVPFEHLVADHSMVPVESIRFFHVDVNWIHALIDGAFSVGVHSERDVRFHRQSQHTVRNATARASGTFRNRFAGRNGAGVDAEPGDDDSASERTGFVMRSEVVSGWPGLEVTAYTGQGDAEQPVEIVRLDRPAPDLLFCVFAARPDRVVIAEPPESLHFGIDRVDPDERSRGSQPDLIDFDRLAGALKGRHRLATFGSADLAERMIETASAQQFGPDP